MPVVKLDLSVFLFQQNRRLSALGILGREHGLLNVPIQDYGEEYVKRYVNRFGSC